jgi:hypothetical protein
MRNRRSTRPPVEEQNELAWNEHYYGVCTQWEIKRPLSRRKGTSEVEGVLIDGGPRYNRGSSQLLSREERVQAETSLRMEIEAAKSMTGYVAF